jgi:hypothetical protein
LDCSNYSILCTLNLTESSAHNIFAYVQQAEFKECMTVLGSKVSSLRNIQRFRCEAYPTFCRCDCKPWYRVDFNREAEGDYTAE